MANHTDAGRLAKEEGHTFERTVAEYLGKIKNQSFEVRGQSYTKVDVISEDEKIRVSVKNPRGKNTQCALLSQASFIQCMDIRDEDLQLFISQFFGNNLWKKYNRHRLTTSHIDPKLNKKFLNFLNSNKHRLYSLLLTQGTNLNVRENVNYMLWTTKKNSVDHLFALDFVKFKPHYMKGSWIQNETTFEYRVGDTKLLHLQMKGSGKRYSSGYHSLMFHIHGGNLDDKYVMNVSEIG